MLLETNFRSFPLPFPLRKFLFLFCIYFVCFGYCFYLNTRKPERSPRVALCRFCGFYSRWLLMCGSIYARTYSFNCVCACKYQLIKSLELVSRLENEYLFDA